MSNTQEASYGSAGESNERRIGGKTLAALGLGLGGAAIAMMGASEPMSLESEPPLGTIMAINIECILLSVGASATIHGFSLAREQREASATSVDTAE
jgi:hypothetical protein